MLNDSEGLKEYLEPVPVFGKITTKLSLCGRKPPADLVFEQRLDDPQFGQHVRADARLSSLTENANRIDNCQSQTCGE